MKLTRCSLVANSFRINYRTTNDTFVRLIQFELAHHGVMTNALVFKINLVVTPTCAHCLEVETIMNAFFECSHMINSWRQVEIWISKHIDKYNKLSDAEKNMWSRCAKPTINAMIIATIIYRKRQVIGLPYIILVN